MTLHQIASAFTIFFTEGPVTNFAQASAADTELYSRFFQQMRAAGINLAPSAFES